MDIYKLSDNIVDVLEDAGSSGYKITDLKQGVKNPDRVNVYVNDKFSFSLDISQVVDLNVKVGRVVSSEELSKFKKASEFGKLYQRTLEWVLLRPRSEKECRDYIWRKLRKSSSDTLKAVRPSLWSSEDISKLSLEIIERLKDKKYLSDENFARYYVENRFSKKGVSAKRLRIELMKKGISKDIIERVLNESSRNDEEEIAKIIAKKRAKYNDEKLIQYLLQQGFSYDLVREQVLRSSETD